MWVKENPRGVKVEAALWDRRAGDLQKAIYNFIVMAILAGSTDNCEDREDNLRLGKGPDQATCPWVILGLVFSTLNISSSSCI